MAAHKPFLATAAFSTTKPEFVRPQTRGEANRWLDKDTMPQLGGLTQLIPTGNLYRNIEHVRTYVVQSKGTHLDQVVDLVLFSSLFQKHFEADDILLNEFLTNESFRRDILSFIMVQRMLSLPPAIDNNAILRFLCFVEDDKKSRLGEALRKALA